MSGGAGKAPSDPYFNQVSLLLHGDGTNGAQNNTFLDSSPNNYAVTRNGNVTQGSFSPFSRSDGRWSNFFNGSTDWLTVQSTPGFTIPTATTPFTIEAWVNLNGPGGAIMSEVYAAASTPIAVTLTMSSGGLLPDTNGLYPTVGCFTGGVWITAAVSSIPVVLNKWTHVAAVFTGSTTKIFINGVDVTKGSNPTPAASWGVVGHAFDGVIIGRRWDLDGAPYFNGQISNFRYVNGTAVYTSNFTPSVTPLTAISGTQLLTCQNNRFKDNSANNLAITANGGVRTSPGGPFADTAAYSQTSASGYFGGSGTYLSINNQPSFDLSSGDFTIEAWIYRTGDTGAYTEWIIGKRTYFNPYPFAWCFGIGGVPVGDGVNKLTFFTNNSSIGTTTILTTGQWYHVAVTRQSGTARMFVNGVIEATTANFTVPEYDAPVNIGGYPVGGFPAFTGHISDLRVIKGTAVYTANFSPPQAPLSPVTGTSAHLKFNNAGIYDSSAKTVFETVGNAQISTTQKKYGTGSLAFDGSGDSLVCYPYQTPGMMAWSQGDITIEAYIYMLGNPVNGVNGFSPLIGQTTFTGPTEYWSFGPLNNRTVRFYWFQGIQRYITTTTVLNLNQWHHIALVKNGLSLSIYIDGAQSTTYTMTESAPVDYLTPLIIGKSSGGEFNGYIDELRITKGVARYTANFTPPAGPFLDQ